MVASSIEAAMASTVFGRANHSSLFHRVTEQCRSTQPPSLSGTGNEYRPKCGDALRLGSKDSMAHSIYELEMWANAQPDGRPAEYRWRPLFNAAKFG